MLTFYGTFAALYYTSMGFGFLTSICVQGPLAQLVGVVAVFSNAMFAGGMPTLPKLHEKFFPISFLPTISFMRYGLESFYIGEIKQWENVDELMGVNVTSFVKNTYGYDIDAWWQMVGITFLFGIGVRILACIALVVLDRDKKL